MKNVQATAQAIIKNVEKVIVGKRQQIVYSLVSWFSEGHISVSYTHLTLPTIYSV